MKRKDDQFPARPVVGRGPRSTVIPEHLITEEAVTQHAGALAPWLPPGPTGPQGPRGDSAVYPVNGTFEVVDGSGQPSNWAGPSYGTLWVSTVSVSYDGAKALSFPAAAGGVTVTSDQFPVRPGSTYRLEAAVRSGTALARQMSLKVNWYNAAGTLLTASNTTVNLNTLLLNTWALQEINVASHASAAYARVLLVKESVTNDFTFQVDGVQVSPVDMDPVFSSVNTGTLQTTGNTTVGGTIAVSTAGSTIAQEAWAEIGVGGAPAFTNAWVNFDAPNWDTAAFYKSADGRVHLKGLVKGGTISATLGIFTLPVGYRPPKPLLFATISNNAIGRVTILTNGNVCAEVGSNVYFSLNGISFRV